MLQTIFLLITCIAISNQTFADILPRDNSSMKTEEIKPSARPDLAEIIPLATDLSASFSTLESNLTNLLDISVIQNKYGKIQENLKEPAEQLQKIKDSKEYSYSKLSELRRLIEKEKDAFGDSNTPVKKAINQLEQWRLAWLGEQTRWHQWRGDLAENDGLEQLDTTFAGVDVVIDKALALLQAKMSLLFTIQKNSILIRVQINQLLTDLDILIGSQQRSVLKKKSPSMFTFEFRDQVGSGLGQGIRKGLDEVRWPDKRVVANDSWILLIQFTVSFLVSLTIYLKRKRLLSSQRWLFLAKRPVSAGLFLGLMTTMVLYETFAASEWRVFIVLIGAISFVRLSEFIVQEPWKKQFILSIVTVMVLSRLFYWINLPLPLIRLYIVTISLAGIILCLRWSLMAHRIRVNGFYAWGLRLFSIFFTVIIIAEVWGKEVLSDYLFSTMIRSVTLVLLYMLFTHIIRGVIETMILNAPLHKIKFQPGDANEMGQRITVLFDLVIWGLLVFPAILMFFRVYDTFQEAVWGVMDFGFEISAQRINIGLLLLSAAIIYGVNFGSWIVQKLIMNEILIRGEVEKGVRLSISRLIHYVLITISFLLVLMVLGFEFTKLTIMLSALGVGIGFGLQSIVNNFVSGLVLLFEQPVRVGDIIELEGGVWVEIKKIGLRATVAETYDQSDIIIPNADLISNPVTNWTLSNRQVRLIIPIGVAYGSDVPLVLETLVASANSHNKVSKIRKPLALFLNFGESTLDFELRVWVFADERLQVRSDLHQEIDRRFREANIEIAFPQRDLHLRSMDKSFTFAANQASGA